MPIRRRIALALTAATTLVGLFLVVDRSGLIAWLAVVLGVALLAKVWLKPSTRDLASAIGFAAALTLLWFGTVAGVISTYESGEVVELTIPTPDGTHHGRVWIFDVDGVDTVYYDAPQAAAASLIASTPIHVTRNKRSSEAVPQARRAEALSEEEAGRVLAAMEAKYGNRVLASTAYYVLLGQPRDRVALVIELPPS